MGPPVPPSELEGYLGYLLPYTQMRRLLRRLGVWSFRAQEFGGLGMGRGVCSCLEGGGEGEGEC